MLDTDFPAVVEARARVEAARSVGRLAGVLLVGRGLTIPVLEAAVGATVRVRVLEQASVAAEQIFGASWR
jgi:hypothetical protein